MLNAKPRQGFMFVAPIKNPWGEMVGNIDISPMTKATPGSWRQVCGVADDRELQFLGLRLDEVADRDTFNHQTL